MTLGIYGTGGSGKELLEMIERFPELSNRWSEIVFIDDTLPVGEFRAHRLMPLADFAAAFRPDSAEIVIAVGEPYYRLRMAGKVSASGFSLATIVHPMAYVSPSAVLGRGVVVRLGSVVSADAKIGDNVWIQTYATIGHDVSVGANSQISSYSMLAGAVKTGCNVFVGISAVVREELEIGDDAVLSMGAVVMRSVRPREIVAGNPAEVIMMNESRRVFRSARHAANAAAHRLVKTEDGASMPPPVASASPELVGRVSRMLTAELPNVDFSRSATMADDGLLDSIAMVRIITALKRTFGVEIPFERITPARFNSAVTIAALVESCRSSPVSLRTTFVESFFANADRLPAKFCLGDAEGSLTYGEVRVRVLNAAARLRSRGVVADDRVVISAVAKSDYVVALLAAQSLGAVTIPVDKAIKPDSLSALVAYVEPRLVLDADALSAITHDDKAPVDPPSPVGRSADQLAEMLFTTGTTGTPKGAMLSNGAIRGIIRNTWKGVGMRADDVVLIPLPLNHSVGMRVLRTALSIGAGVVVQNGFAFAETTARNIADFGVTALVAVPTAADALRTQMGERFAEVLSPLRYIEFGAGSVNARMKRLLVEDLPGVKLFNTWGSSETGGAIFLEFSARPDKADAVGLPVEGVTVGMVDANGRFSLARDAKSAGRLALKGDMRMSGYYRLPAETASALRGDWLVTNDLAYVDDEGFVHLLGRADDIINVGGEKVAPIEVENAAGDFPGLKECACIGVSDALLGQVPCLFYVPESADFDEAALSAFLTGRLERYQVPKRLVRLDALPRNAMSKLDRRALRGISHA